MKKKTYKSMQNRYLRTLKRAIVAEARMQGAEYAKEKAEETAEYYEGRFREFGSNVKTFGEGNGISCVEEEWKIESVQYGTYAATERNIDPEYEDYIIGALTNKIAKGLVERNLVQVIKNRDGGPFDSAIGVKLFVVPWERMPHEHTTTIRRFLRDTYLHGGI